MKINGYSMFMNEDEAIYCAKSKEDVYNYFVDNYGSTEELQEHTKDEFINALTEIDLNSDYAQKVSTWYDEGNDKEYQSSYYEEYKAIAKRNIGTYVVCFLTW